jgi:hypothetical protein
VFHLVCKSIFVDYRRVFIMLLTTIEIDIYLKPIMIAWINSTMIFSNSFTF